MKEAKVQYIIESADGGPYQHTPSPLFETDGITTTQVNPGSRANPAGPLENQLGTGLSANQELRLYLRPQGNWMSGWRIAGNAQVLSAAISAIVTGVRTTEAVPA